ncbi:MAG: hypothetical protein ACI93L_003021 [Cyclobacteriaceae bacterium]|jgi:hypothetical protein
MNWKVFSLSFVLAFIIQSCGVYSFTGASISPDIKTISIGTFYNNAALGPSNMSVLLTESVKDYYQQNTSLSLVEVNGDLQLEGYISDYTITPVTANAGGNDGVDYASLSRITIRVFCSYVNTQDDEFNFEKNFSFFVDFDQNTEDLSSNEEDFVQQIFDQIILDIFNASVANW